MPRRPTPEEASGHGFAVVRAPADEAGRGAQARRVVEHLARHEPENNLPIGVAMALADGSLQRDDAELLLAVDGDGATAAALVMTPPYRVLLAHGDDPAAVRVLHEDLRARRMLPPGVVGPEPLAGEIAAWWADREGLSAHRSMRQGVYRLGRVAHAVRTRGSVRVATPADAGVVVPWLRGFWAEVGSDVGSPEESFRGFTQSDYRRLYLFEDGGEAVAMAGLGARTPRGRRIGPVYTPPEHRRKGYAEALVAAVVERALAAGNEFCFLYTDLDYPTSNAVYERVGFDLVIESAQYDLVA